MYARFGLCYWFPAAALLIVLVSVCRRIRFGVDTC
jgi:hypothetical protein